MLLGIALVVYGAIVAYFLVAIGWGGFLSEPLIVQMIGFGVAGAIFVCGVAALSLGGYRTVCRRSESN
jgi:hypothetical protein